MNKNLKPKILELREQGFTYDEIVEKLQCSKGTISYHLGEGVKEKTRQRTNKNRNSNPLRTKYHQFKTKNRKRPKMGEYTSTAKGILKLKRDHFATIEGKYCYMFTLDELIEHIGDNPKCYLTGKDIDLSKSRSYSLDHIVPRSKGGDSSLENCGLACREANQAKSDLSLREFVSLCELVVNKFK